MLTVQLQPGCEGRAETCAPCEGCTWMYGPELVMPKGGLPLTGVQRGQVWLDYVATGQQHRPTVQLQVSLVPNATCTRRVVPGRGVVTSPGSTVPCTGAAYLLSYAT